MNESITDRLSRFIKFMGLTHEEFAKSIGMKKSTFSNKIQGTRGIDITMLVNILTTYPILSADWLLTGEGNMEKMDLGKLPEKICQMITEKASVDDDLAEVLRSLRL